MIQLQTLNKHISIYIYRERMYELDITGARS